MDALIVAISKCPAWCWTGPPFVRSVGWSTPYPVWTLPSPASAAASALWRPSSSCAPPLVADPIYLGSQVTLSILPPSSGPRWPASRPPCEAHRAAAKDRAAGRLLSCPPAISSRLEPLGFSKWPNTPRRGRSIAKNRSPRCHAAADAERGSCYNYCGSRLGRVAGWRTRGVEQWVCTSLRASGCDLLLGWWVVG